MHLKWWKGTQLIKMRAKKSVRLPKLPLQGGQRIFVHNTTKVKIRNCGFCFACDKCFSKCQFRINCENSRINGGLKLTKPFVPFTLTLWVSTLWVSTTVVALQPLIDRSTCTPTKPRRLTSDEDTQEWVKALWKEPTTGDWLHPKTHQVLQLARIL